jgi:hypothetical protein
MSDETTFTLEEARSMLPILRSLLKQAIESKQLIEQVEAESQELNRQIFLRGGMSLDVKRIALRKAQSDKAVQLAKDAVAEIHATGVQVKDLDIGLLDFPCEVNGEIVLLCWKYGEEDISHWHGLAEGFAGRKPITADMFDTEDRDTH